MGGAKQGRRVGDLRPNPKLWEALDHGAKLREILTDFYTRVYADERLAPFFEGVTQERAIGQQYSFLRDKITGDNQYFGDRPRNAHHWMVISDELFDYREEVMMECLGRAGLAPAMIAAWRAIEEVFRKQIVKSAPIPRKVRGVALPLDGYEVMQLTIGGLCDGCEGVMSEGDTIRYHVRTGKAYCTRCQPR